MLEIGRWARQKGMKALDLEASDLNAPGLGFYASMGFSPLSRRMAKMLDGHDAG